MYHIWRRGYCAYSGLTDVASHWVGDYVNKVATNRSIIIQHWEWDSLLNTHPTLHCQLGTLKYKVNLTFGVLIRVMIMLRYGE